MIHIKQKPLGYIRWKLLLQPAHSHALSCLFLLLCFHGIPIGPDHDIWFSRMAEEWIYLDGLQGGNRSLEEGDNYLKLFVEPKVVDSIFRITGNNNGDLGIGLHDAPACRMV